ncbi:restriction endonuclease subunit S [Enterobacter cloacae]|uniref:restriction endonuclease subunit S n=1 Tax=Enterobacter cloacae complex TaxID=354276 RepID=UPI0007359FEF|nr:restriction endonuclease subunit S [Enterobacter cloacae]MCK7076213.1 restriction endonuclease subunit S [Enterobacter roggenkampii]KTH80808.1 hypothetical protein ASV16_25455 [Enterobacter cloacae subsp. cloacae]MCC1993780.1 restriction endonuclease subunit S [Enterobacter cloacae]MCC2011968.1 restriction endonuclease subunit S [Enterobacter cloacae]MCC2021762.1 restriction endonuclease subunit S [Enterobacter cloacae]
MISISELVERVEKINPNNKDGSWKYIDIASVDRFQKKIVLESVSDITSDSAPSRARQLVFAGDIIISTVRPNLNTVAIVPKELDGAIASTGFCVLRPNKLKVEAKYLFYYVKSEAFVNSLVKLATGANYPAVSDKIIKEQQFKKISLCEQKKIATILDKADGIRQKREQAIKLADDFLHTMFQKTFNSQSFLLNGWEQKELKDIALIQTGPFGTQLHKEDYIENGIPLINPTNIKNGIIIPNFKLCVERHKYDKLKEYHLKKGDIIMGRRGEMGRCALINDKEDGWFCGTGSLFIRLNTPNEILSFYLNEYLSSEAIKNFLKKESRGVTMANLNKDIVGKIKINIPSANALTSFMKVKLKVDSIKKKINHSDLETLLSSLSKKYF